MAKTTQTTVEIRRVTVTTDRAYDDVVEAIREGLGQSGSVGALQQQWNAAGSREEFDELVRPLAGPSGLIEFLSLDLGAVLDIRDPRRSRRMTRIIAGNPVTMSKMAATTPDVGSYAPVTLLVVERPEGVTVSYDQLTSAIEPYADAEALAVARELDAAVLALLHTAAG
jgi:uncharacterized protein (DUF302 family)